MVRLYPSVFAATLVAFQQDPAAVSQIAPSPAADPTIARHDQYMTLNYPRSPITMVEGRGSWLTDSTGKKYLDLFSGFGAGILGHCHPALVEAGTRQMNKLWHVGNLLHTDPQTRLAAHLSAKGFGGRSFFAHSGSDANEAAFKLARLYGRGKRFKIISTLGSFHGRGFAAMMATGQEKVRVGFAPYLEGFSSVPYNDIPAMAGEIDEQTVAIIVEPIQGEGGVNTPDANYLRELRRLCDERDLLLIFDEVWTGCGRTGKWFGYQHWDVQPDIMTLGKAIGAGLAVGAMVAHPRVAELFDSRHYGGVPHATTLGGNCVAMAVSAALFDTLERDNLLPRAAAAGDAIVQRLRQFGEKNPALKAVRGKGLFIGIDLEPTGQWFEKASQVVSRCMDRGLLIGSAQSTILRLAPPMTISDAEIAQGLDTLEQVILGN
jgi:acetylornithine/N-succinyldiaminopimelate aminotransferase